MTRDAARTTANVVLVAAGLAAAYVVVTTPPLRRLALRTARVWFGVSVPAYLMDETRQAWVASDRADRGIGPRDWN
ncbi:MAG TPA: hypothetical protein VKH42_06515 [Vicinamibacterales bacterium]|nr:hypothetical protein [Vicinamibacterales bacterium]